MGDTTTARYTPAPFTPLRDQCPNCGHRDRVLVSHCCEGDVIGVTHCGCFHEPDEGQEYSAAKGDCVCAKRNAEYAEAERVDRAEALTAAGLARRVREARGDALRRIETALLAVLGPE